MVYYDITMQKKMAPFTKMTEMTPDNVINYVTSFAAEVRESVKKNFEKRFFLQFFLRLS